SATSSRLRYVSAPSTSCSTVPAAPMSTTMPLASSASPRKVASTTNVAPCSRCAGPNTSPWKLWAIIMWSRTVTLNTKVDSSLVADDVAQRGLASVGDPGHGFGQVGERRAARQQRVEGRIAQQVKGEREPIGRRAVGAPGRCDPSDLAGAYCQSAGMERAAELQVDGVVAVPAQLDHLALGGEQV